MAGIAAHHGPAFSSSNGILYILICAGMAAPAIVVMNDDNLTRDQCLAMAVITSCILISYFAVGCFRMNSTAMTVFTINLGAGTACSDRILDNLQGAAAVARGAAVLVMMQR